MPFEVTKLGEQPAGGFEVTKLGTGQMSEQSQAQPEEESEGWLPYIGRNIAQLPTTAYSLGRSYGGLGNIFNAALQDIPMPDKMREFLLAEQEKNVPTISQAHQQTVPYLPRVMTEQKPGDEWFQSLVPQAGLMAATGGLSSLPAAAESILSTLGVLGGSQLGGNIAQTAFPESKLASEIGSIAGGLGGGLAGRLVPGTGKSIMPSRALAPEKVLAEAKPEQKGLYQAAEQLAENVSAAPTDLLKTTNDLEKNLGYGMEKEDVTKITNLIDDIKARTQSGEVSPAGTLSLEEAKAFRRNINDRFKDKLSPAMRHNLGIINKELKDFILKEGSEQHNKLWLKAENLTKNIGDFEKKLAKAKDRPEWLNNIMKLGKLGVSPTIGYVTHLFGASPALSAGVGGLSILARKMFNEATYLREISKKFPTSYNKYLDTIYHATKSDSPKVILRLNSLAEDLNKQMPL